MYTRRSNRAYWIDQTSAAHKTEEFVRKQLTEKKVPVTFQIEKGTSYLSDKEKVTGTFCGRLSRCNTVLQNRVELHSRSRSLRLPVAATRALPKQALAGEAALLTLVARCRARQLRQRTSHFGQGRLFVATCPR